MLRSQRSTERDTGLSVPVCPFRALIAVFGLRLRMILRVFGPTLRVVPGLPGCWWTACVGRAPRSRPPRWLERAGHLAELGPGRDGDRLAAVPAARRQPKEGETGLHVPDYFAERDRTLSVLSLSCIAEGCECQT